MHACFHVLMSLFFTLLLLFTISEFTIHSTIPGRSQLKLISNISNQTLPHKVIFVVIDALRYDYMQKLPFISAAIAAQPANAFALKCQVGTPTMTTQRVQSLMTGSQIFSSANIAKSFFASKISTDNIIEQLNAANKSSMVLGDDTWVKLFSFTHSRTCSNTFNVHDYDTCDQPIYQHMIDSISKGYDLIVAHFLSLDHIGHSTSAVNSHPMELRMKKISALMEEVMVAMDDESVLLLTGDHGMREDGNHGGSSPSEIYTFLFGFSKKVKFMKQIRQQPIDQSNLTPTLSLYLDIPLPLNSVGVPIIQALPSSIINHPLLTSQIHSNLLQHFQNMISYYNDKQNIQKQTLNEPASINAQIQHLRGELQFLKYSTPNELANLLILILISIVSAIIVYLILDLNGVLSLINWSGVSLLDWSNKLMMSFSLFSVYFSWYLIKNLSNIYLLILFLSLTIILIKAVSSAVPNAYRQTITIVLYVLLLCQLEPQQNSQYSANSIQIAAIHRLLSTPTTKFVIATIIFYHLCTKASSIIKKWPRYTMLLALLLSLINYILSHCLHIACYELRAITLLLSAASMLISTWSEDKSRPALLQFSTLIVPFLGESGPIVLMMSEQVGRALLRLGVSPLVFGFLGEMMWWILGNRFEYSGVDVVKSYMFSSNYHAILNGACMLIVVMAPHLTLFLHLILLKPYQSESEEYAAIKQMESANIVERSGGLREGREADEGEMLQLMVVGLLGLVSCLWNVDYNNSKILFTVVYIPMLIFCTIKVATIYLLITACQLTISRNKTQ